MKIIPLGNQILVKRIKEKKGVLDIPDSSEEKPQMGIVESFGKKIKDSDELKEGDKILFRKFAGDDFPGSEEFILIDDREIIGKVED